MSGRLTGKSVLVTGGCGDIGRAVVRACRAEGTARIAVVDLPTAIAARPEAEDERVQMFACDVADRAAVRELFAALEPLGSPDVVAAKPASRSRFRRSR
jgi:NAD(P)-dependent dehydrogenase (short-subunit alcohol dehydrogenase family)